MCGGIMAALTMAIPEQAKGRRGRLIFSYNVGRLLSYTVMGVLVGLLSAPLAGGAAGPWLRVVAGLLLIGMGLCRGGWSRGLTWWGRGGSDAWGYGPPPSDGLMPVERAPEASP